MIHDLPHHCINKKKDYSFSIFSMILSSRSVILTSCFSVETISTADPKPDGSAAHAEHRNGEHKQAGIIVRSHHVDAVDDQVTPGTQDQDHKNDLCPFLRSVIFTLFKHAYVLLVPVQSHLIRGYLIPDLLS